MAFDSAKWSKPRQVIATGLNDLQYGVHGGLVAIEVLRAFNDPWDVLQASSLLDFGCGTGRIAKVISKAFARVDGYDPSKQAIAEGGRDCPPIGAMKFHNVRLSHTMPDGIYDYSMAVNVFEHIAKEDQMDCFNLLLNRTRRKVALYVHPFHNAILPIKWTSDSMQLVVLDGKAK